ncbi:MAG: YesL family protein [Oscillospiraceae bacterium]|nr:YesL family protein [Oscillospiraceae bacterium]
MKKIFRIDSGFWSFFGKLIDATVLHLIWLVCCIPVFTIGPATTAIYYALMTDISGENSRYISAFFHSFKTNFKQGVFLGLIYVFVGACLGYGLYFYANIDIGEKVLFFAVCHALTIVLAIAYVFSAMYVFALHARFVNNILKTIKNSFFLSIKNVGWTMVMAAILCIPYLIIYFTNFVPLIITGYGLVVYLKSYVLNHVLRPYITALSDLKEETGAEQ